MQLSTHINSDEKGNIDISKTNIDKKAKEGVISSHNLIPNDKEFKPQDILKEEKENGSKEG
jgi:hypothetical protein